MTDVPTERERHIAAVRALQQRLNAVVRDLIVMERRQRSEALRHVIENLDAENNMLDDYVRIRLTDALPTAGAPSAWGSKP